MKTPSPVAELKRFFARQHRGRRIGEETKLFDAGILDSLSVFKVALFVEKAFRVKVAAADMTPKNFATIKALARFVGRRKEGKRR